jgi:hypothetical protein
MERKLNKLEGVQASVQASAEVAVAELIAQVEHTPRP